MATPIKYSTTAVENTIKTNNIVIGTKTMDYGPTSSTGFYAGVDPPASGYTIYFVGESNQINARCSNNDNELIHIAQEYGKIDVNTVYDAISFFITGSTGTTIVNMDYPKIITSGLTHYLDAKYINSYLPDNNRWNNIVNQSNYGIVISDLLYTDGYFSFNGNDRILFNSSLNGLTISFWFRTTATSEQVIIGNILPSVYSVQLRYNKLGCRGIQTVRNNFNDGIWHNVVLLTTANGFIFYVDGLLEPIETNGPDRVCHPESLVGCRLYQGNYNYYFIGDLSRILSYNRILTDSEIFQNYLAIVLDNNIIKDELILYIDPGNIYSYNITGSTIYDLSGNRYNGQIIGTLPYNDENGGYFDFLSIGNGIAFSNSYSKLFPGINNYTWCGWLKFSGYSGNWRDIWYGNASGGHKGFGLALKSTENKMRVTVYGSNDIQQTLEFSVNSYLNEWHYFTIVLDRNDFSAIIYIDSIYQTTLNFADWASLDGHGFSVVIGYHYTVETWQYDGSMGPVHIYQKSLSSTEILQNYNALKYRFGL